MQSKRRLWIVIGIVMAMMQHVWADFQAQLLNGDIESEIKLDRDTISLTRDVMATLSVWAPATVDIELPNMETLRGRFQGFSLAEGFERAPEETSEGRKKVSVRWRLVADPTADRYRLAPFAITIKHIGSNGEISSLITRPILFPLASLPDAAGDVEIEPKRFFVWPTGRMWLQWSLWAVAGIFGVMLVIWGIRRIRKAVRLHRMTPRERAFAELEELLGKNLVDKGLFKDFYIELTHVVRRYIERAYRIRAPRLTTEEFLQAAKVHPHFTTEAVARLSTFLRSADMVKFAGVEATPGVCGEAVGEARHYIEWDCEQVAQEQSHPQGEKRS